jgi:hypothetical protein
MSAVAMPDLSTIERPRPSKPGQGEHSIATDA